MAKHRVKRETTVQPTGSEHLARISTKVLAFSSLLVGILGIILSSGKKDDDARHEETYMLEQKQLQEIRLAAEVNRDNLRIQYNEAIYKTFDLLKTVPLTQAVGGYDSMNERITSLPAIYLERGLCHAYAGDYKTALRSFDEAEQRASPPEQAGIYKARGIAHLIARQNDAAKQAFLQALHLNPLDACSMLHLSFVHLNQKHPKSAIQLLDKLISESPQNPLLWLNRCSAHMADQAVLKARCDAEVVLKLDPDNAVAQLYLGQIAFQQHRPEEAIAHFSKGTGDCRSVVALYCLANRAYVYLQTRDNDKAKRDYKTLSELLPGDPSPIRQLGRLAFYQKCNDEAQHYFNLADSLAPESVCYSDRMQLWHRMYGADSTIRLSKRLLQKHPDNIELLYAAAVLHLSEGNDQQARDLADRALKLTPTDADILLLQGKLAQRKADYEQALGWYSQVVARYPDYFEGYYLRAILHLSQKEFNPAFLDFQAAASLNPQHAPSLLGRGLCLGYFHEPESAALDFEAARTLDPRLRQVAGILLGGQLKEKGYAFASVKFAECLQNTIRTDFESFFYNEPVETTTMLVEKGWIVPHAQQTNKNQRVYSQC